jgi:hypothetical protein
MRQQPRGRACGGWRADATGGCGARAARRRGAAGGVRSPSCCSGRARAGARGARARACRFTGVEPSLSSRKANASLLAERPVLTQPPTRSTLPTCGAEACGTRRSAARRAQRAAPPRARAAQPRWCRRRAACRRRQRASHQREALARRSVHGSDGRPPDARAVRRGDARGGAVRGRRGSRGRRGQLRLLGRHGGLRGAGVARRTRGVSGSGARDRRPRSCARTWSASISLRSASMLSIAPAQAAAAPSGASGERTTHVVRPALAVEP